LQVEPVDGVQFRYPVGNARHWQPVAATYTIASTTRRRSTVAGRPIVPGFHHGATRSTMRSHSKSVRSPCVGRHEGTVGWVRSGSFGCYRLRPPEPRQSAPPPAQTIRTFS
jgi:hypothetical protein